MQRPVNLDLLFRGDRLTFQILPGDKGTYAHITVAELKEMALALHVSNERIQLLYQDLQKAEGRIDQLERQMGELSLELL